MISTVRSANRLETPGTRLSSNEMSREIDASSRADAQVEIVASGEFANERKRSSSAASGMTIAEKQPAAAAPT